MGEESFIYEIQPPMVGTCVMIAMTWQITYDLIPSGIIGMVLIALSLYITLRILKLIANKRFKKMWIIIEIFILLLLCGYGISISLAFMDNSRFIASIAGIVYLFAGLFIALLMHFCYLILKEHNRIEHTLTQLNMDSGHVVEERTKLLKTAQEKIMQQEKSAEIGKLAGSVAHELRNPLGIISNSIYFLDSKYPATDEKIKKHLTILREQSDKAVQIIKDLIDFAWARPNEMRLGDIVVLIQETLIQVPKVGNIEIRTRFGTNLPAMLLDYGKMQQAFLNIIHNAIQAMPAGGTLEISAAKNEAMIEIAFKDTGTGIPEESVPLLFKPLFSTKTKGLGLGLAIANEIVTQHGGTIEVKSEIGVGSTFTIILPIQEKKITLTKLTNSFW